MSYIEPTKRERKMEHCFANNLAIDMEHILIPEGISDKLKGKTIEKTSFHPSMNHSDENHLVITFTDGTYISVAIEYDDDHYLEQYITPLSCYNADAIGYISGANFIIGNISNNWLILVLLNL